MADALCPRPVGGQQTELLYKEAVAPDIFFHHEDGQRRQPSPIDEGKRTEGKVGRCSEKRAFHRLLRTMAAVGWQAHDIALDNGIVEPKEVAQVVSKRNHLNVGAAELNAAVFHHGGCLAGEDQRVERLGGEG